MTMKHVLSPNPYSPSDTLHTAWDRGYWTGRKDVVEQYGGHAVAAQAPAMARLLLAMQWADGERVACPSCGAWERDGHTADCELAAVLRAAGVMA